MVHGVTIFNHDLIKKLLKPFHVVYTKGLEKKSFLISFTTTQEKSEVLPWMPLMGSAAYLNMKMTVQDVLYEAHQCIKNK